MPEVRQGLTQQDVVAAVEIGEQGGVAGLVRGEPGEVERVLLRRTVTGHGHDIGE